MDKSKAPFYDKIELAVIIVFFSLMLAITAFTVCSRYIFSFTFSWAEQLTRIMFVWITFAGISWAGKLGVHMRVSAVAGVLGEKYGRLLVWFGDAVTVFFGFHMAYKIAGVMLVVYKRGQIFATVPWIPVWIMYLAGVLGMLGLSLRIIQSRLGASRAGGRDVPAQVAEGKQ
ncbi:MAG: TRAP transporter small permease [Planctomycetota bacterium]|jgi:TRAP-type C4-dicarboxylate transport system permease small subunit|nr:TRAP transporter small permease [Planctomycetota bacterium]